MKSHTSTSDSLTAMPGLRRAARSFCTAALSLALVACGGGGGSTPTPPPDPADSLAIEAFGASRAALPIGGGAVTLAWTVRGADSLRIDQKIGTVAGTTTDASVRRTTRFTLTATRGTQSVSASTTVAVAAPPLSWHVNAGLAPASSLVNADGSPVPQAAVQDAAGVVTTFVANELVVATADRAEAEALAARLGGRIVDDDSVPAPPAALGLQPTADALRATRYVVRVDPATASLDDFAANAARATFGGDFGISSTDAARLLALVTAEQAAGRNVVPNMLGEPHFVLNATSECANAAAGCIGNAFTDKRFQEVEGTSQTNVLGAWQFIAGRAIQRRVRMAIIDGGFWIDPATGLPRTLPGVGHDYPTIAGQYDFSANRPFAGAPNPAQCGDADCPWHGNGAASVALGMVDNGQAAAGTGGQVADAFLLHADIRGSQKARALRTARAWSADLVSMSFGVQCNSACDLWKLYDDAMGDAVAAARRAGIVMVASAGNKPVNVDAADVEPCNLDGVICVGALDDNTRSAAGTSGFGPGVDIWAPSNLLAVYAPTGVPTGLSRFGGTSASAPFIAGIAAMMKAINPALDSDQVRDMLRATAFKENGDIKVTFSVDALAAVRAAAGNKLLPDAYEAPGAALPSGRIDDLSIDSVNDRDEVRFTVSGPSRFFADYDVASHLGKLRARLVMLRGCGTPMGEFSGGNVSGASEFRYGLNYIPPGDYALRLGAYTVDAVTTPDLTAYSMDWLTAPVSERSADIDAYEPNDSLALGSPLASGSGGKASLHVAGDVDHYRVRGAALATSGPLTLDSYLSIPITDVPLRLTLLTLRGEDTGVVVESDPNCSAPLGIHLPEGDYIVKVESPLRLRGNYEIGFGKGIAGVFVPHAPLKWEARKGLPFESILSDPAIDHLYIADGTARTAQVLGQGVGIAVFDAAGTLRASGQAVPGFDGTVVRLDQLTPGEAYFIELSQTGAPADLGAGGKLPGLNYRLTID
jgi:Subtilase family